MSRLSFPIGPPTGPKPSEWQPIDTAPRDGTTVWVAVQMHLEIKRLFVQLARYDSWNHQWRQEVSGKELWTPRFWQTCPIPKAPEWVQGE